MAEQGQERTEDATPKRKQDARKKGQSARSAELPAALGLLAGLVTVRIAGPLMWQGLAQIVQGDLAALAQPDLTANVALGLLGHSLLAGFLAVVPLLAALMLGGVVTSVVQTGGIVAANAIAPKFDRVNPGTGLKRLLSTRTGFELGKTAARLAIFLAVAASMAPTTVADVVRLGTTGLSAVPAVLGGAAFDVLLRLAAAGAILAALDYLFQRWQFTRGLRMTRQEVRDELRQTEGDPQIKQRIRRLQRQRARQRMMQAVPQATVVLANPTHVAVALRYESGKSRAPVVVAKGRDLMAQQIKALAAQHGVPIIENPPLARSLYASVKLGREIPFQLYRAVAEVLAFVYRLKRRW
jgi:flagellar biosynthetic protein FlhB